MGKTIRLGHLVASWASPAALDVAVGYQVVRGTFASGVAASRTDAAS